MTKRVMVLVALLAGCGGSDGGPVGPAMGTGGADGTGGSGGAVVSALVAGWGAQVSSTCVLMLGFSADGTYVHATACTEASGRNDFDEERGTFFEDPAAGQVDFMATSATCADATKAYHYGYAVERGKTLTITASDAVVVMTPLSSWSGSGTPSMGVVLTLGCISMGVFTPGPLMPVQ